MVQYADMKLLNGSELADYIKERQAKQVRGLVQAHGIIPKLVIIRTNPDVIVDRYMKIKSSYGSDINVAVEVVTIEQSEAIKIIQKLNDDQKVHGIIVQIPLPDASQTDEILNSVTPEKDVDGLGVQSRYDAPTPLAISWLLAGYNVDFRGKHVVIVGHGRLVGRPLAKLWEKSDYDVEIVDKKVANLGEVTREADILVTATGVASLIKQDMVKPTSIIVDAGVATDSNGLVGDVDATVRELPDITITPEKGGVGPLTVAALFDNVIQSAEAKITSDQ